jgi:hypothetical protein
LQKEGIFTMGDVRAAHCIFARNRIGRQMQGIDAMTTAA